MSNAPIVLGGAWIVFQILAINRRTIAGFSLAGTASLLFLLGLTFISNLDMPWRATVFVGLIAVVLITLIQGLSGPSERAIRTLTEFLCGVCLFAINALDSSEGQAPAIIWGLAGALAAVRVVLLFTDQQLNGGAFLSTADRDALRAQRDASEDRAKEAAQRDRERRLKNEEEQAHHPEEDRRRRVEAMERQKASMHDRRYADARDVFFEQSDGESAASDRQLLVALYRLASGKAGVKIDLEKRSELHNPSIPGYLREAELLIRLQRAQRSGFIANLTELSPSQASSVELAERGVDHALRIDPTRASITIEKIGVVEMGDTYIRAGKKAVVVNRSVVIDSLNQSHGKAFADAWENIVEEVERTGNDDAKELVNEMSTQLRTPSAPKSVLRTLFSGLVSAAPAVKDLTEAVATVMNSIS